MHAKQEILDEIKRTAKENDGRPLGAARFENETGIKPYDWGRFWVKFGDAQQEAGFVPNQFGSAYVDEFLIEKLIVLMRELNRFPGQRERTVARNNDATFPSEGAYRRFASTQKKLAGKICAYCSNRNGYEDVIEICTPILGKLDVQENSEDKIGNQEIGEVYLYKHDGYYKIGRSNDTVRRGQELQIQLPKELNLIHTIKTDDPSGVEAYWHKRFEAKRMKGEWFNLNSIDIKAFKRWRRI